MPLPFNKSLDLKLLRLVRENPILYNTKHDKYLDFDSREVIWHKIGDTLNRPATEFAAIQCQIHFGDFQEDKHKPGLIENLSEYLPEQYSSSWGMEKKILKSYRQHHGLSQVDAKCLYTKTARDLPTYGVTFFLVKEKQKGKKKLVPRLLGINSESVLRLDELSKEVLQAWPLTQVRTYHVGKSDSFTLNFGDYSEKEYSVKTNEAHRIRDILEGYIDLIRKRLGAPYGSNQPDSAAIAHDSVEASRGNVITHVTNTPSKIVEQTFIGPSRILPFEQGSEARQGTQIMTVQQVVVTSRGTGDQRAVTGEVPMRSDMSLEFVKKLNHMNSNSVQIVTLLADPTEDNISQAQSIIRSMQGDMPDIIKGVKEAASKQSSEDAQRKLLEELDELCDLLHRLAAEANQQQFSGEDAQECARRIADLTTQMYFSVDPRTRRRSEFLRRSRQSFIAEEEAGAALRRQALDASAAAAAGALHHAKILIQEDQGPVPTDKELEELEASAAEMMARLDAAVALLTAHSDPNNADYSVASTSLNTIKEILPQLAKDASALSSSSEDDKSRRDLLDEVRAVCDALARLCELSAAGDHDKIKEAADSYADVSGKLIYTIGRRNRRPDVDAEKERGRQGVTAAHTADTGHAPIRRAYLAATASAAGAVDNATVLLSQECVAPAPSQLELYELRLAELDTLGALNAAVARCATAHADPTTIDYSVAATSMNTVSEVLPQYAQLIHKRSVTYADDQRQRFLDQARAVLAALEQLCARAASGDTQSVKDAASSYADVAEQLVRTNACGNIRDMNKIAELSEEVGKEATRLLVKVNELTTLAETEPAACDLDAAGVVCADAARHLLTTAKVTASTIHQPQCQSALTAAAENLSSSAQRLAATWRPLVDGPGRRLLGEELDNCNTDLERALNTLRNYYADFPEPETASQRVQRVGLYQSAVVGRDIAKAFMNENEASCRAPSPELTVPLPDHEVRELEAAISNKATHINTAVLSLYTALSDPHNPDYETADQAMAIINQLLPEVIKDTKTLSSSCEGEERKAIRDKLFQYCMGIESVCINCGHDGALTPEDAVRLHARTAHELLFGHTPCANTTRGQLLLELAVAAEQRAAAMAAGARDMPQGAGGARLRARAAAARARAPAVLLAAQLTAPSIHEPHCRAALLSSVDALASSARELVSETSQLQDGETGCRVLETKLNNQREEVQQNGQELEKHLEGIREACREAASTKSPKKPPVPTRTTTLQVRDPQGSKTSAVAKGVPTAATATTAGSITQDFLHQLRCEESQNKEKFPPIAFVEKDKTSATKKVEKDKASAVKTAKDERVQKQLGKTVENGRRAVDEAAEELKKVYSTQSTLALEMDQSTGVKKDMEQTLARAAVAAAALVAANHPDAIDYQVAAESSKTLAELTVKVAKDAEVLSSSGNEKSRRLLLAEILALCEATNALCAAASDDRQTLNEAAIAFGDKSARLLYIVSTDVDPAQEKDVIIAARAVGDSASRAALDGARAAAAAGAGAGGGARAQAVCDAGRALADAAGALVYTAKLVAPSIHHPECQNSLVSACNDLSTHLATFKSSWQPLAADSQLAELVAESDTLEELLEGFRADLASGKLVKRREVEMVVVEDTALRQLALQILEDAKKRAEHPEASEEKRRKFAGYSNQLTDAIRRLDLANSRCRLSPQDLNKRRELENAVQNLQVTLLQARPTSGDQPQNNIVDLTDYVKALSLEAEKLIETANKTTVARSGQALESIKEQCAKIKLDAFRLMNPTSQPDYGDPMDEILEVGQFGQDCDMGIRSINSTIQGLDATEKNARNVLLEQATALSDSCNLLRFATNSALATAQSAALDETLNDLALLEQKIDNMLLPVEGGYSYGPRGHTPSPSLIAARARLVISTILVSRGNAQDLAPAFAAYVTEMRAGADVSNPHERTRLKAHLQNVLDALRALTAAASARVAVWEPVQSAEVAVCTQNILKELENPSNGVNSSADKGHKTVLNEDDILKLLLPAEGIKIDGDKKQLEEKLQQTATKLSSLTGTVVLSASRPASLARSLHTLADAAAQLADISRAVQFTTHDPVHRKRIEEASQEMRFATYSLLKTSELLGQEPNNTGYRRRLLDACRLLNDSINKLGRTASSASKLQKDCNELHRSLQTHHNLVQGGLPTCALSYAHCLDALGNQQEVIQKLNSEAGMSREEFVVSLGCVAGAVGNSTQYAAQCSYLISISEENKEAARRGLVDVTRMQRLTSSVKEFCLRIMRGGHMEQARHEENALSKQVEELKECIQDATSKTEGDHQRELAECRSRVDAAAAALHTAVSADSASLDKISTCAMSLVDAVGSVDAAAERAGAEPPPDAAGADVKALRDDVISSTRTLLSKTQALVKEVNSHGGDEEEMMTWVMFGGGKSASGVVEAFQALMNTLRQNGHRAGVIELAKTETEEDVDAQKKSYVQIQLRLAYKWLHRRPSRPEPQAAGEQAVRSIIHLAEKLTEDLKGQEKEDMRQLTTEAEQLLGECGQKYDNDKANVLMERVRELCKAVERGVVTRVVEDFLAADAPLADLDILADAERDDAKRKFLLEKKIAELLAQLGRATRTARLVADASGGAAPVGHELRKCTEQTELLAPLLVKAAEDRVRSPDNAAAVEAYKRLLAQYALSLAQVRDLCDRNVDPMDFVQTAGETMQRMREESSQHNDPQRCAYTSVAIRRLANRVIDVGMSSSGARGDPELLAALAQARRRLAAAEPGAGARASRLPHWKDTTAEILRTTGEVESVLGGENIFKKQPEPDQPIYNAALGLHAAVREWSARDNEIVAVAKRMAVLMARLADHMHTDKKRELIATSKSIVSESHEVARLAKKLALECTDVRIRTNLLQVCERIPTISGQLKMLTTVKGSSLGRQGTEEDKEAMNMLVGNAQNLMLSVQEVVKAAASASVKIASQSGARARMRWVRRDYY